MDKRIWGTAPHFNPISSPVYVGLYERATLCRHSNEPIIQAYNTYYDYWTTARFLTRDEAKKILGGYEDNCRA